MRKHPGVEGTRVAGFSVLPMLNSSGIDDALLFWRWSEDRTALDTVDHVERRLRRLGTPAAGAVKAGLYILPVAGIAC